jgi:hypothetical protein
MQVRAVLSFTTEQTRQDPSRIEVPGVVDLFASFSTVIKELASASSFLLGFTGLAQLSSCVAWGGEFDDSTGLDNEVRAIEDGSAEVSIIFLRGEG